MAEITLEFDTIAAISTPPGEGAISIVRLSGDQAVALADKVYSCGKKSLLEVPSHTIHYGHIVDPKNEQLVDEVMVSVMLAPKTFTREDVVEINCHGGIVVSPLCNRGFSFFLPQMLCRISQTAANRIPICPSFVSSWFFSFVTQLR